MASVNAKIKYPNGKIDWLSLRHKGSDTRLAAPGKYMGYTAYGKAKKDVVEEFKNWFN